VNRVALILVAASLTAVGLNVPARAIDVKPAADSSKPAAAPATQEPEKKTFETAPVRRETRLLDKLRREVRAAKRSPAKQYDNYIDKDGDGVDDRLAKKAKVEEQTESQKSDTAAQTQKKKVKQSPPAAAPPNDNR
jgi:hypothetical protein